MFNGFDDQTNQAGEQGPQENGFIAGAGEPEAAAERDRLAGQSRQDFIVKGNIKERGQEHGNEVKERQVSERGRRVGDARSMGTDAIGNAEKSAANRLPMFEGGIRVARRP